MELQSFPGIKLLNHKLLFNPMKKMKNNILVFLMIPFLLALYTETGVAQPVKHLPQVKNIIIMIGDGMGFNHIQALNLYQDKKNQIFENFPVKLASATYPAKAGEYEAGNPSSNYIATGYNPSLAWKDTAYLKRDFTESAASGTALGTGFKTYNNAIGLSVNHDTLENMTEWAKATGRSAGVVTSVPFCHATPAGFTAHNISRVNYSEIAQSMLFDSRCDVIMGCGDPGFDQNGQPVKGAWKKASTVIDSATWVSLIQGSGKQTTFQIHGATETVRDIDRNGKPDPWTIIRAREDFKKLTSGKTPKRILGVPMINSTLQQGRSLSNGETRDSQPFLSPFISTVPTLSEMTLGALNVLDNNSKGFFLMVEGGAIDWAGHGRQKGRLIEEMTDFSLAVESVVEWVEKNSSWDETLLVVTADHETGLLWGDTPFKQLVGKGKGTLPEMTFFSSDHTNSLVGFYATGAGSELYRWYADEYDEIRGPFIHNSEVPQLMRFLWFK
jgi:alkaline phosphatase